MSSLAFLVTELQSLASETRRKHPEVREAAEKSLAILRASPEQAVVNLASDGPQSNDLLRPVFMGCATKNAKVVAISLGSLQRLIALKAVPQSAVNAIIMTMSDAMSQGVDIQLRILQTLVSLIMNFPEIHAEQLGDALLLCFKLQESRIAVVSSTAAATLRQLVMFVVDKMVEEDRREDLDSELLREVPLPDGTSISLGPSARDAFSVFEDLCLLANSEKPHFLNLESLQKTFALELIESVLTNYHEPFRQHPELILLLRHHLCPLLLRSLSERPIFPLTLRCTRVIFLLLKQFSSNLVTESEVFLMLLIRLISEEPTDPSTEVSSKAGSQQQYSGIHRPGWMRVLAMEVMRGLCTDAELIRTIYDRYDAQDAGSKVFSSLVTTLKRLITEKSALLGVYAQMQGVGVQSESSYGMDVGGMAGRVATAASATVSGVVGMIASTGGLSSQGSAMKLQCIDQLDKADAPPIPELYIYLLAVQALTSLCEGLVQFTGPIYTALVIQKRGPGEGPIRAPPALDLFSLSPDDPSYRQLNTVKSLIESGWPALLAALSFVIATNLSDDLFVEVLSSYQALISVAGMLGLTIPRDALLTSLSKFAVPTRVVSSLDTYAEPPTPRSATSLTEGISLGLGLGGGSGGPPTLSERNIACLKVVIYVAGFLAGSLGESWFGVLEVLQNADYVLTYKGTGAVAGGTTSKRNSIFGGSGSISASASSATVNVGMPMSRSTSTNLSASGSQQQLSQTSANRHPMLVDLSPEWVQGAIQRLLDATRNFEDTAFRDFINALCRLSSEMVGMQTQAEVGSATGLGFTAIESESTEDTSLGGNLSPKTEVHRRRVSGIHIPRTLRSGDFGITKLGQVAMLNIHRLIYRAPDIAWNTTTSHLLSVIRLPYAPQPIRLQAARVLDDILVVVPRNLSTTGDLQAQVQRRVLDVLAAQVIPDPNLQFAYNVSVTVELRRMGLETLHQILESSGHTLVVGWEVIFQMLESVCRPLSASNIPPSRSLSTDSMATSAPSSPGQKHRPSSLVGVANTEKSHNSLVKIAFLSLKLVCDSVSTLSPDHLRLCISTLGQFGRQSDTNIALTAAASLLWSVSDAIQAKRREVPEAEPEYSSLWMFLLAEVLGLCTDERAEVRDGAIQTLFRTMQLYGNTLNLDTWEDCVWRIIFPLLDNLSAQIRKQQLETIDEDVGEKGRDSDAKPGSASVARAWDESKVLALQSLGSIFYDFLAPKIVHIPSFEKAWDVFVTHIQDSVLLDDRTISAPALRCLEKTLKTCASAFPEYTPSDVKANEEEKEDDEDTVKGMVPTIWQRAWIAIDVLGGAVLRRSYSVQSQPLSPTLRHRPFTQDSLVAYVDVIQSTKALSRRLNGKEWPLDRLTRLMAILKGVLTYPNSPDYRPDIDNLPPLQAAVMDAINSIDLSLPGSPSLVMRDLSEFATLPFIAAFDVQPQPGSHTPQKRVTYIAIAKKTMPMLVELFLKFKDQADIYVDGTVEAIVSAYSIPIKLKYDCPAPSKHGKDQPLWKTATTNFLRIVKECASQMQTFGSVIPDDRIEGIWHQILDVFRGGILADCTAAESFSLEVQEAEENFDLSLIASLEIDVAPYLGNSRVPDQLVSQLGKILHQGSLLYHSHSEVSSPSFSPSPRSSNGFEKTGIDGYHDLGSTHSGTLVPRERFSYWCFDLLFLVCSDTTHDQEESRRRLAVLNLASLLNRCRSTLLSFIADEALRGNLPFPRAREDEVLYVLRKLLELKLWQGSLWAALSDNPTKYATEQPPIDTTLTPTSALISDAIKRSPVAHLFHFYPMFCEIAALPRRTPLSVLSASSSATIFEVQIGRGGELAEGVGSPGSLGGGRRSSSSEKAGGNGGKVVELDARNLARECLKIIGKEMGCA
ncbi:hypothetical protein AX16_002739 [Volvariella volvacea WC 439]|nr:hypothetical protein AX16_002739 [Volvariella volvacea WC 439]